MSDFRTIRKAMKSVRHEQVRVDRTFNDYVKEMLAAYEAEEEVRLHILDDEGMISTHKIQPSSIEESRQMALIKMDSRTVAITERKLFSGDREFTTVARILVGTTKRKDGTEVHHYEWQVLDKETRKPLKKPSKSERYDNQQKKI